MDDLDDFDDIGSDTVFRDVILLALIGFVAMVVMLLPHINQAEVEAEDHKAPGNVIVEMHWPQEKPFDVDLWVQGPESGPVGFWNKGNEVFNLLRDDLGIEGDATDLNYEVSYSRGILPGEYVVNTHMYGYIPAGTIVPVKVVVSVRTLLEDTRQLLQSSVLLTHHNQERTVFSFRLTKEGEVVEGSVTTLYRPLITGGYKN
ncbi:MAG: hypothetical protein ACR2PA_04705 [Hyphomicrobiaceae bacterium]